MNLGLENKKFVVGGASRGLGRAVAKELVAEGARVLLVARDEGALGEAAKELGERAHPVAANLAEPEGADVVAAMVDKEFNGLDGVLVNTGGPPAGKALELGDEQWLLAYQLLLGGPLHLLRELAPRMSNDASILFVTSSSVRQPIPNLDTSNVLRPGVAALAKCLARELGPKIRVNSLAPGRFATDRVRSLDVARAEVQGISAERQREATSQTIPLARYGEPAELGRVAVFLLSPAASYVTGVSVQVDGGLVTSIP